MTAADPTVPARKAAERQAAIEAVETACRTLIGAGQLVTFDAVAERAQVARNTLFRRPELYEIVARHIKVQPPGKSGPAPAEPGGPLDHLARRWIARAVDRGEMQGKSVKVNLSRIRSLTALHGERPVHELDDAALLVWLASIADLAPATRRAYIGLVRRFCGWLTAAGHLQTDPAADLPRVKEPRRRPRALNTAQVAQALQATPKESRAVRTATWLRPAMLVMVACGLRCIEISRLDVDDYDPETRTVFVKGKGGHERILPVPAETAQELDAYLKTRAAGPGPLFRAVGSKQNPDGRLSPGWIATRTGRALTAAGVHQPGDRRTAHALRHTAATDVYRRTNNARIVQQMLGHQSLETTQIYLGWASTEELRTAMEGRTYKTAGA